MCIKDGMKNLDEMSINYVNNHHIEVIINKGILLWTVWIDVTYKDQSFQNAFLIIEYISHIVST